MTDFGIVILTSEEQPLKTDSSIVLIAEHIVISLIDMHLSNADAPIEVTKEGIVIVSNFVQSLNVRGPISISGCDNRSSTISWLFCRAAECNIEV